MDHSKSIFNEGLGNQAAQSLVMLDFESVAELIRSNPTEFADPMWQECLAAINRYLVNEEPNGALVRKMSGSLGMGPQLAADSVKLGDKAPERIRAIAPVLRILYDDFIKAGGSPYTQEDIESARREYTNLMQAPPQQGFTEIEHDPDCPIHPRNQGKVTKDPFSSRRRQDVTHEGDLN